MLFDIENLTNFDVVVWAKYIVPCYNFHSGPRYANNLTWEMVGIDGIIFVTE